MSFTAPNIIAARIGNRVLRDYPLARTALIAYAHARVDVRVGPVAVSLRITPAGAMEPLGEGTEDLARVSFNIPLSAIPRLAMKDEAAFREIAFTGDSEMAQMLSTFARNLEWDIEEDLSQLLGGSTMADALSHRVVGSAKSLASWRAEASQRLTENVAEYLIHERQAFITLDALSAFARDCETLRDDVARLEARLQQLHHQTTASSS